MKIENDSASYLLFIIILLVALTVILIFKVKRRKNSAKNIVYNQYAHIELSQSKQQIGFYARHQKVTDTVINLTDIKELEVQLNKTPICHIKTESEHGFNEDKALALRVAFKEEHINKMIQGRIRQITLAITDHNKQAKNVCIYLRKGSDRITKNSYHRVIEDVIDWCWLIAAKINPTYTTTRVTTEQAQSKPLPNHTSNKTLISTGELTNKEPSINKHTQAKETSLETKTKTSALTIDTELVDALEKLVKLRQQGFLTLAEFTQAKAKLLQHFTESK